MAKHALIVDDSKTACRTLAILLDRHGIDSTSVYSAEAALEELRHRKPDIIFMDQSMPGMDGLETVKIIKGNPDTATIPVMMYTAKEGDVYLGQARALGALDVLPKGQLKEKLDQALDKLRFGAEESEAPAATDPPEEATQALPGASQPPAAMSGRGHDRDRDADLRRQLQSLRTELSRQLYMVLTEDQITQKEYARWLLEGMDRRVSDHISALEASLAAETARQAEQSRRLGRRRHLTMLAAWAVVGALCLAVLWQGARTGSNDSALQASLSGLTDRLATLENAVTRAEAAGDGRGNAGGYRLGIAGRSGEPLGVLLGLDDTGQYFAALSRTDYIFHIDPTGQVGIPLQKQYFAVPNCNGQPLAHGQAGVVYRNAGGSLWYTSTDATALTIRPASAMNSEERCKAVDMNGLALRPLRPNDPEVTGVSADAQPVSLVQR